MHPIQEKLLELARHKNLAKMTLREMAAAIGEPGISPQKVKHHLLQIQKKGFLVVDRNRGSMDRTPSSPSLAKGFLNRSSKLFSIPLIGTANCGPATIFAEQNFQGFLRASSRLVGKNSPAGLFAIKTDGSSMNRAEINGKKIEDGDFVIIDSNRRSPRSGDVVLAIVDDKATIKRFVEDNKNNQIVLRADSSFDYDPIYIHEDDSFAVNGTAISVIKNLIQ